LDVPAGYTLAPAKFPLGTQGVRQAARHGCHAVLGALL